MAEIKQLLNHRTLACKPDLDIRARLLFWAAELYGRGLRAESICAMDAALEIQLLRDAEARHEPQLCSVTFAPGALSDLALGEND